LSKFREKLARKVAQSKVEGLMKKMVQLIKKGRTVGLQVTPYKASMTKSKVLLDAGDVEAAYQLVSRQVDTLETTISERRQLVARLDKLRGNLLAQEGKLSRLERSGVSVEEFKERVDKVKQLIEDSNHNEAEEELLAMDQDINRLLTMKPEQLKREMMTTIMEEQESRPLSIDRLKPVSVQRDSGPVDTDQARSELFTLIPKIKLEISKLHSQGLETEDFKMDIERIQNLVIKRQYLQAYELGKTCYRRMTSQ
jgi:nucleoside diphosphate kinase